MVAVIRPPKLDAPEKVTKSFSFAPCALSVTVIVVDPFEAEKLHRQNPLLLLLA